MQWYEKCFCSCISKQHKWATAQLYARYQLRLHSTLWFHILSTPYQCQCQWNCNSFFYQQTELKSIVVHHFRVIWELYTVFIVLEMSSSDNISEVQSKPQDCIGCRVLEPMALQSWLAGPGQCPVKVRNNYDLVVVSLRRRYVHVPFLFTRTAL